MIAFGPGAWACLCLLAVGLLLVALRLGSKDIPAATNPGPERWLQLEAKQTALLEALQAGLLGLRTEAAHAARLGREEANARAEQTGEGLRLALHTMAGTQHQRLEAFAAALAEGRAAAAQDARLAREEMAGVQGRLGSLLQGSLSLAGQVQAEALAQVVATVKGVEHSNERRQEALRQLVEQKLDTLRQENMAKLEQMRQTVDEKLQGTLEQRLGASFSMVNANLERVFKSVGEMQAIAHGIGDLKRVLSNVKSRGTWGETALAALLEQSMTSEQYQTNVEIVPGSNARVEFAIRLPQDGTQPLWLPIDAKLPTEDYERLQQAAERGDAAAVEEAGKGLERAIRLASKDICQKYVRPPHSTDFAVMFLPTEGLFAEVVRRPGLVDAMQREHRVVACGPTTLGALLASLRMGFRTLAIQQRSSEVWEVLGAVKAEFGTFGTALDKVLKKLDEARNTVEAAGTRRRAVDKKLRAIEALPGPAGAALLAQAPLSVPQDPPEASDGAAAASFADATRPADVADPAGAARRG